MSYDFYYPYIPFLFLFFCSLFPSVVVVDVAIILQISISFINAHVHDYYLVRLYHNDTTHIFFFDIWEAISCITLHLDISSLSSERKRNVCINYDVYYYQHDIITLSSFSCTLFHILHTHTEWEGEEKSTRW